jgi:hypothetical protein
VKVVTIGVGAIVAFVAWACGGSSAPERPDVPAAGTATLVVVTADPQDPDARRLAVWDRATDAVRPLDVGLASAWAPCVTYDARRVCFLGRGAPDAQVSLYMSRIDGTRVLALSAAVDARSAPAWLPDGRIVYAAPAGDGSRALFVVDPRGGEPRRITFGGTQADDPTVLEDGRILYVEVTSGGARKGRPALFCVHPDGSGVALLHAETSATRYARPRQAVDGTVAFLATTKALQVLALDWRAPHAAAAPLPVPEGTVLVEPLGDGAWASLARDDARGWLDACSAEVRPRPQGHLSMVRDDTTRGRLLCVDARREGSTPRGARVRFVARAEARAAWRVLGEVPLEADGSFFVDLPADVALRLVVLDADGSLLFGTRTPFWVRPNEVRGLVGVGAPPDATPPNRTPISALAAPVELRAGLGPEAGR